MNRVARAGLAIALAGLAASAAAQTPSDANARGDSFVAANDYGQALAWYRYSAARGNAPAQVEVAYFYQHGLGGPQDYGEAVHWYRLAADQGNPIAQNQLGYMFEHGLGVGQDYDAAARWFALAAAQGWPAAQHNLAWMASQGRCPTTLLLEARGWMIDAKTARNEGDRPFATAARASLSLRGRLRP